MEVITKAFVRKVGEKFSSQAVDVNTTVENKVALSMPTPVNIYTTLMKYSLH